MALADRLSGPLGPCNLKFGQVLASLSPFLLLPAARHELGNVRFAEGGHDWYAPLHGERFDLIIEGAEGSHLRGGPDNLVYRSAQRVWREARQQPVHGGLLPRATEQFTREDGRLAQRGNKRGNIVMITPCRIGYFCIVVL